MTFNLSEIFGHNMVLQRDKIIKVWGTAPKNTTTTVEIQGKKVESIVDISGNWIVDIGPLHISKDETLIITNGKEIIQYENVAVGEVWLAGGQSNMEFYLKYDKDYRESQARYENDNIRFFDYPVLATEKQREMKDYSLFGFWRKCEEENLQYFSAVAYYFAQNLQENMDVPIGIIGCNCGGTRSCCWMDEETIKKNGKVWLDDYDKAVSEIPDLQRAEEEYNSNEFMDKSRPFHNPLSEMLMYGVSKEELIEMFKQFQGNGSGQLIGPWHEWRPSGLYDTMLKKIIPYTIKGVIWYQGESDDIHPDIYADMMCGLINCWRREWGEELPFIMSQLAPLGTEIGNGGKFFPILREQQEEVTDRMKGVYCISIGDVGSLHDIHPKEKQPVGKRMALLARGVVYGEDILCEAPVVKKSNRVNNEITVTFSHADTGLFLKGKELNALSIYDKDNRKVNECLYKINIVDNKLIIQLENELSQKPIKIAFAKEPYYEVNLYNGAEIPVKPFCIII